jgi:GNAT superfamily N-acetyltransferase
VSEIIIRAAEERDAPAIWKLINELAIYEKAGHEMELTVEQLTKDLVNERFHAFVALDDNDLVGIALFYPIYSTWKGLSYYLEDFLVNEPYRRRGIGTKLFEQVMLFAKEHNAGRLGWQVLNWNTPAIEFYKKYNATLDETWITCRLYKEQLQEFELIGK